METIKLKGKVDSKGKLKIDIPTSLKKGDVEIVVILQPGKTKNKAYDFSDLAGKLAWKGNPLKVQKALRDEW